MTILFYEITYKNRLPWREQYKCDSMSANIMTSLRFLSSHLYTRQWLYKGICIFRTRMQAYCNHFGVGVRLKCITHIAFPWYLSTSRFHCGQSWPFRPSSREVWIVVILAPCVAHRVCPIIKFDRIFLLSFSNALAFYDALWVINSCSPMNPIPAES